MASVSLGKIAFSWKKEYNASTVYAARDVVSYNGDAFICEADGTVGIVPGTNAAKWSAFAQGARNIATTAGDVIYHNGAGLTRLPAGKPGQVLAIGPNGLPYWTSPEIRSGTKVLKFPENARNSQSCIYRRFGLVMTDNSIRLWGQSGNWDMGDGSNVSRILPQRPGFPPGFPGVEKLIMGYAGYNYVIDKAGKLWFWGWNATAVTAGAAGDGSAVIKAVPFCVSNVPTTSLYGKTVVNVILQTGNQQYPTPLVLCSDGTLHATGYNGYGQVGDGTTANKTVFTQILTDVVDAQVGGERYSFGLALKTDGSLWAWGYNAYGQCAQNNTANVLVPTLIQRGSLTGKTISKIYAANYSAFAIDTDGGLHAWGYNNVGQLGNTTLTNQLIPVQVALDVVEVRMNSYDYVFTLIRKKDGTVWACGAGNSYGNPTAAGATASSTFIQIAGIANAVKIIAAGTGGYNYGAALLADGTVKVWGYNGVGQLGVGDTVVRQAPDTALTGTRLVVDICNVGTSTECALAFLMDDGTVMISGSGYINSDTASQACYVPIPVIL